MTFLECINRIFRQNGIIRGDTDTVATFNDTQHNASLNIAIVAVQDELVELTSDRLIPKERVTTGVITLVSNTRSYSLASDFTRFYGEPHFYRAASNRQIYEYPGGLERLQVDIFNYATQYGQPNWWYWEPSTALDKQVGFFLVPGTAEDGELWTYDYEASVLISNSSDTLPFNNTEEAYAFTNMASRRFKFMFEDVKNEADVTAILMKDVGYKSAKARLMNLLRGQNPARAYGVAYQ